MAEDELAQGLDLAVSLGGDGTMLRTVDLVAGDGVPVLGVNVGQLGYLAEVEPPDCRRRSSGSSRGDYDDRGADDARRRRSRRPGLAALALNEAVIEKTPLGHTVRLRVSIAGDLLDDLRRRRPHRRHPDRVDGVLAVGPRADRGAATSGPCVLTPVSPHMLFDRAMSSTPTDRLRLEVCGPRTATLSVDGRNLGELHEGEAVVCTGAPTVRRASCTFGDRATSIRS